MAIVCGLNAAEAWKIYQYGPDHPLSKKILKHKIRDSSLKKLKKKEQEKMMKKLFLEGYSKNAIAEAFECLPETVTALSAKSKDADTKKDVSEDAKVAAKPAAQKKEEPEQLSLFNLGA